MPISNDFVQIRCLDVVVERDERQRRQIDTKGLRESIERHGVIHPIVIRRDGTLVAGERRLKASIELGLPTIPARYIDSLDAIELQIIEAEENRKRQDLDWQDIVRFTGRIHGLYRSRDPDWTISETADALCESQGHISEQLIVYTRMIADEGLAKASTMREAYNQIERRDQRAAAGAAEYLLEITNEILAPGVAATDQPSASTDGSNVVALPRVSMPLDDRRQLTVEEAITQGDFVSWAPGYTGRKFNLIHCDFPYGINVFSGPQSGRDGEDQTYDDDPEVYWRLLAALCAQTNRIATLSAHLVFWYSRKNEPRTVAELTAAGWKLWPHPWIWHKTDNSGIAERPQHGPRHVYETAIFASRGDRPIVSMKSDVYGSPTDRRLHPSAKPEPMLFHFLSMLVDENTRLLDPTCGAGSALLAAERLGAEAVVGLDIDENNVKVARRVLADARAKRIAAARLGV